MENNLEFEKTVPSNRRLVVKNLTFVPIGLDRVTCVGTFDTQCFERCVNKYLSMSFFKVQGSGFKVLNPETFEELAYCNVPEFQEDTLRFDFNPNLLSELNYFNLKDFIHELIPCPKLSRIDLAFDMINLAPDLAFELANLLRDVKYSSYASYTGKSRKVETHYWGAPSSDVYIRLYNKLIEQKRKKPEKRVMSEDEWEKVENWWRLEFVLKRQKATENWQELVEKNLDLLVFYEALSGYSAEDICDMECFFHRPELFAHFSKYNKKRIKNLLKGRQYSDYKIKETLVKSFIEQEKTIKKELSFWLNSLDIVEDKDIIA